MPTPIEAIKICNETKVRLDKCEKDIVIFQHVLGDITKENTLLRLAVKEEKKAVRTCLELTETQDAELSLCKLNLQIAEDDVLKWKKATLYVTGGSLVLLLASLFIK